MAKKADKNTLRNLNKQLILNYIRKYKEISRTDLTKYTKLSPTTISSIISELLDKKMIVELRIGESSGGRKPLMYGINENAKCVLAIGITPQSAICFLLDLKCNEIYKNEYTKVIKGEKALDNIIKECICDVKNKFPTHIENICGIGISLPGTIDSLNGVIKYSSSLKVTDYNVILKVKQHINVKTYVYKDTDALILGEYHSGIGSKHKDFIYILVEDGVGMSYIHGGSLFRLPFGGLELGHTIVNTNGLECRCGNRGCLGAEISEIPAIKRITELIEAGFRSDIKQVGTIRFKDIIEYANNGDAAACKVMEEQVEMIGIAVANVINLFNPELIIIGGPLSNCNYNFIEILKGTAKNRSLKPFGNHVKIELSKLGNYSAIVGMANEIYEKEIFYQ